MDQWFHFKLDMEVFFPKSPSNQGSFSVLPVGRASPSPILIIEPSLSKSFSLDPPLVQYLHTHDILHFDDE